MLALFSASDACTRVSFIVSLITVHHPLKTRLRVKLGAAAVGLKRTNGLDNTRSPSTIRSAYSPCSLHNAAMK